jgi:hypothetical protein
MSDHRLKVLVTVNDELLFRIESVATSLRLAGMSIDNVMADSGIITGRAHHESLPALSALPGVAAVEPAENE